VIFNRVHEIIGKLLLSWHRRNLKMNRPVVAWAPISANSDALHPLDRDDLRLQSGHLVVVPHHRLPVSLLVAHLRVHILS
jgi:hypothetical protein